VLPKTCMEWEGAGGLACVNGVGCGFDRSLRLRVHESFDFSRHELMVR